MSLKIHVTSCKQTANRMHIVYQRYRSFITARRYTERGTCYASSVCPSVRLSVCRMRALYQNGCMTGPSL